MTQAFRELVQIGITLTSEQDLATLLERILTEARRFTRAEAGTLFLREGDQLRFSVVQNDKLARELGLEEMRRRLQADPLSLRELSLAGHVALTGDILNLHDTYMIPPDRPYSFDPRVDARLNYRTQSILVVPLQDPANNILGVLELINALDRGRVVPFDSQYEGLVRSLASQAAVALRNARLEDLSFKDALTDVYNRRYFTIRMEEEFKRHCRFGEPLTLALLDLDHFKKMTDREQLLEELLEIGLALTTERDLYALLERVLVTARRFTQAEVGALFLREGDHLRFAVVQNDFLQRKLGTAAMLQQLQPEPLRLTEPSLAGHVAQTGEIVNVAEAYAIGVHETRALNRRFD